MRTIAWPSLAALALLPFFLGALSPALAQAKAQSVSGGEVRCSQPLTIAFVDLEVSPFLHGSGDHFENPPGFFVLWAKAEAKRLQCEVQWLRLPPARLLTSMQAGAVDMAIGQAPTPDREKAWIYPRTPSGELDRRYAVLESNQVLYARADRAASLGWDGKGFGTNKHRIGAPRGSKQMTLAQRMGWTTVPTMGTAQGLRMLRAERFEALLAPDVLVPPELLKELPALVALQPPLQQTQYYAPVSPAFWKRDPELVQSFWRGLCRASRAQSPALPACP